MGQFTIAKGEELVLTHVVTQNGATVNLTGGRMVFVAKLNRTDPDASAFALFDNLGVGSTQGSITFTNALGGVASIHMLAAATEALAVPTPDTPYRAFYEIWFKDSDGNEWRTDSGTIRLDGRALVQNA